MEIRRAALSDFKQIMEVYRYAQDFMIRSGNPDQWGHFYPTSELVQNDIINEVCHVICENGCVHGVFALTKGPDSSYQFIESGEWLNNDPYLVIHRIAGDGQLHGLFRCAADYAKRLSSNVRVDTHHDNTIMQKQIEKNGFERCGIIYLDDGSPRIAYHWEK